MCYYGCDGRKFPEQGYEGDGFKEGDIVEVVVDRSIRTVRYSVNGVQKATQTNEMLNSSSIFMPFVEMFYANSSVEWML